VPQGLEQGHAVGEDAVLALVGCHGLVIVDDSAIGETMEKVALAAFGWVLAR